jgi:ComF family protein
MGRHLGCLVADRSRRRRALVCPVPMPWQRRLRRGYNQSALIGDAFSARCDWPVVPLLRRARYTPPQSALIASHRTRNVRRSFEVSRVDLSGWDVWLVDDVKTTGATLSACARLLKRAGADRVNVAVAAVA